MALKYELLVWKCIRRYRSAQIILHGLIQQASDTTDMCLLNQCESPLSFRSFSSTSDRVHPFQTSVPWSDDWCICCALMLQRAAGMADGYCLKLLQLLVIIIIMLLPLFILRGCVVDLISAPFHRRPIFLRCFSCRKHVVTCLGCIHLIEMLLRFWGYFYIFLLFPCFGIKYFCFYFTAIISYTLVEFTRRCNYVERVHHVPIIFVCCCSRFYENI